MVRYNASHGCHTLRHARGSRPLAGAVLEGAHFGRMRDRGRCNSILQLKVRII